MDVKQLCVANVRYKRPTANEGKSNKNLLGYLTYRDSRDQGVKMTAGVQRWNDCGMGRTVSEIAQRCEDLRSEHVLTFSLVINPNPQVVALIPHEQRDAFIRQLTESVVEDFFVERGIDTGCEYSYVVHHRESTDLQSPGMANPHAHVVLPGTVWSEEHGERVGLYFSRNQKVNHIDMLHRVTEHNMVHLLERYIGPDWEQRVDLIEAIRDIQRQVTEGEPHAYIENDAGDRVPVWAGARQTDEQHCAIGYYMPVVDSLGHERIEFRQVCGAIDRGYAEGLSQRVGELMHTVDEPLERYIHTVETFVRDRNPAYRIPDYQLKQPTVAESNLPSLDIGF